MTNEERVWKVLRDYLTEYVLTGNHRYKGSIEDATRILEDLDLDGLDILEFTMFVKEELEDLLGSDGLSVEVAGERYRKGTPLGRLHFEKKNGAQLPFDTLGELVAAVCSLLPVSPESALVS